MKRTYKITPFLFTLLLILLTPSLAEQYKVIRGVDCNTNVILLTVDTFRPDHLGCYGYKRDTTPFLDRIARKGVIFKSVISSSPWTSPGMISIFTGFYPSVHGVRARGNSLLPGTTTIFKAFRKHGFKAPNISYLRLIPNFANLGLLIPHLFILRSHLSQVKNSYGGLMTIIAVALSSGIITAFSIYRSTLKINITFT